MALSLILDEGLRGGVPGRPFWRTLKESCKGLARLGVLKNKHSTHTEAEWSSSSETPIFFPYDQPSFNPTIIQSLQNNEPIALADTSSIYDWISTRDIASAICWIIENEVPFEVDIGTSIGFTNLDLLRIIENLLQLKHRTPPHKTHKIGLSEVFVVGKNSPLHESGWLPEDTLHNGLEWVLGS